MTFKIFRRGSGRCLGLLSVFLTVLVCLYYISIGQPTPTKDIHSISSNEGQSFQNAPINFENINRANESALNKLDKCYILEVRDTNITTLEEYTKFDFQPEWMRTKEFWDKSFEVRFEEKQKDQSRPPLKVILVPHSHNDPGWLKTFTHYFQSDTRQILNIVINKMQEFSDMTFIWTEISFLQLWWDQAHPTKKRALLNLIRSGRFEITTGGWVMTDEANVHVHSMLDQLIEGHQWLKTNLNVTPKVGWSIDPFGHGSTVPYLLSASNFEGAIIQRIHYAWKEWFARNQFGDFIWQPFWKYKNNAAKSYSLLTHNMPFDIYSIKHSCGPHPFICLNFDFRKIPGEYTEYSIKAQFVTNENIAEKSLLLLEQYARTASLYPHNVALIPIGDDFRYNKEKEVEQQYTNYKMLIDYINDNKHIYNTEISFGTPKNYFEEIKKRFKNFPTLKGDFFVYSDIFSEGRPAYWSGYFTTRPFYKLLSNDLENNLRSCEILFTIAYNNARQNKNRNALKVFEKNYERIILARRNLGLFQHHDAITGTSKSVVMRDYGTRLFESIQDTVRMQEFAIEVLLQNNTSQHNFVLSDLERENYSKIPRKTPIFLQDNKNFSFNIFNSLAHETYEIIAIRSKTPNIKIIDDAGLDVKYQINPVWNITDGYENTNPPLKERIKVSMKQYEVIFLAKLPALSLVTYKAIQNNEYKNELATIYCDYCSEKNESEFIIKSKQPGDIQLENFKIRLLFDEKSGFLKSLTKKNMGKAIQCNIKFGSYKSAQFHSGAYLFKIDPEQQEDEKYVLEQYDEEIRILITSGPIASDVTVVYGPFLAHTVRIFNTKTYLDSGFYIENDIDFESPPKNREVELYMRFITQIENGDLPEFYTDQNGFQYHRRVKIPSIGVEGNYYPITTSTFIQDKSLRLTILTNHAQGSTSYEPGQLEVMLDRRTLYDDYRGMGEGIVDNRLTRHKFWILIEDIGNTSDNIYNVPSKLSNRLGNSLRYPPNIYFLENSEENIPENLYTKVLMLKSNFPYDIHMVNLRTLTDTQFSLFPSRSALLILQRQPTSCYILDNNRICSDIKHFKSKLFKFINVESIIRTTITGNEPKDLIHNFNKILLDPLEISTFNFTFSF